MKTVFNVIFFLMVCVAPFAIAAYFRGAYPLSAVSIISGSICFGFTWVYGARIGRKKPFTCVKCMAFWSALLLVVISDTLIQNLGAPLVAFTLAMWLDNAMNKYL